MLLFQEFTPSAEDAYASSLFEVERNTSSVSEVSKDWWTSLIAELKRKHSSFPSHVGRRASTIIEDTTYGNNDEVTDSAENGKDVACHFRLPGRSGNERTQRPSLDLTIALPGTFETGSVRSPRTRLCRFACDPKTKSEWLGR